MDNSLNTSTDNNSDFIQKVINLTTSIENSCQEALDGLDDLEAEFTTYLQLLNAEKKASLEHGSKFSEL